MKVLLINTPTDLYPREGRGRFYETIPPMGLGYVATTAAEIVGRDNVVLIDGEYLGLHPSSIAEMVASHSPEVVGVNALSPTYHITRKIIQLINGCLPETKIIVGGPHAILDPEGILRDSGIRVKFVCGGWGEEAIGAFLKSKPLKNIPGIFYLEGGKIKRTETVSISQEKLDGSYLDHTFFENDPNMTESPEIEGRRIESYILSSRGCSYDCRFSAAKYLTGGKIAFRSITSIFSEIDELRERKGVNYIRFVDDLFLVTKKRFLDFWQGLRERGMDRGNFGWEANGRADILSRWEGSLWELLRASGLRELEMGIESGSPRILEMMNKKITPEQVEATVRSAVEQGIRVKGFLMVGFPGEKREDLEATLSLATRLKGIGGEMVRLSPVFAKPYPGTPLWEIYQEVLRGGISSEGYINFDLTTREDTGVIREVLNERRRYNAVSIVEGGRPFVLSEYTDGASAQEVIGVLRDLILISSRERILREGNFSKERERV